jgi:hypothetical protein
MASDQAKRRRGGIRERGGVYQVRVYVGTDTVTGERVDLTGTAPTEREAEKLLPKCRYASRPVLGRRPAGPSGCGPNATSRSIRPEVRATRLSNGGPQSAGGGGHVGLRRSYAEAVGTRSSSALEVEQSPTAPATRGWSVGTPCGGISSRAAVYGLGCSKRQARQWGCSWMG